MTSDAANYVNFTRSITTDGEKQRFVLVAVQQTDSPSAKSQLNILQRADDVRFSQSKVDS